MTHPQKQVGPLKIELAKESPRTPNKAVALFSLISCIQRQITYFKSYLYMSRLAYYATTGINLHRSGNKLDRLIFLFLQN